MWLTEFYEIEPYYPASVNPSPAVYGGISNGSTIKSMKAIATLRQSFPVVASHQRIPETTLASPPSFQLPVRFNHSEQMYHGARTGNNTLYAPSVKNFDNSPEVINQSLPQNVYQQPNSDRPQYWVTSTSSQVVQ